MPSTPYHAALERFIPHFRYEAGELWVEDVPVAELAKRFGTPIFIYSRAQFLERAREYRAAFEGLNVIHHVAMKANDNLTLLNLLHQEEFGADAASGGELHRADLAGMPSAHIVFNGNGKGDSELIRAHRMGIAQIIVDALFELPAIVETAGIVGREKVPIALRLNPSIDPITHPYLATGIAASKFGVPAGDVPEALAFIKAHPVLELDGLHTHLGSMIVEGSPYLEGAEFMLAQGEKLREEGFPIRHLSLGGGFGVPYAQSEAFALLEYTERLRGYFADTDYQLHQEPGRYLFAESAILVTSVRGFKQTPSKNFLVVDAGMTDNLRPALYKARHPVVPVRESTEALTVDLVGPLCESGDFLALDVELPQLERGDLVAQCSVGAYSYAMQSHYNGRLRPPECLVNGANFEIIRDREQETDLDRKDLFFPAESTST